MSPLEVFSVREETPEPDALGRTEILIEVEASRQGPSGPRGTLSVPSKKTHRDFLAQEEEGCKWIKRCALRAQRSLAERGGLPSLAALDRAEPATPFGHCPSCRRRNQIQRFGSNPLGCRRQSERVSSKVFAPRRQFFLAGEDLCDPFSRAKPHRHW